MFHGNSPWNSSLVFITEPQEAIAFHQWFPDLLRRLLRSIELEPTAGLCSIACRYALFFDPMPCILILFLCSHCSSKKRFVNRPDTIAMFCLKDPSKTAQLGTAIFLRLEWPYWQVDEPNVLNRADLSFTIENNTLDSPLNCVWTSTHRHFGKSLLITKQHITFHLRFAPLNHLMHVSCRMF